MIDTVEALLIAGEITPRKRVTADDLEFAATWLEAYEGNPEEDRNNLIALASVAGFLRREVAKRDRRNDLRK